ncbi:MAG: glycosyltransferase family 1 protein [Prevotellaceae bacterium]|nr:glycosyltransferase family 1 protein [Prevotellaceae bacterium]
MRILLLGEYSNVHWTLAQGLRALGHEVCVVSDGDRWKNYPRDIDLKRRSLSKWDTFTYFCRVLRTLPRLRHFDVVQVINPVFFDIRAGKIQPFYNYLRRHNGKMFMGAFGMDHYWVKTCLDCTTFRYSDFNIGQKKRDDEPQNQSFITDWLDGEKTAINRYIAEDCDGIISGLYEYDRCYRPYFPDKTHFIPFPIDLSSVTPVEGYKTGMPIRFFIGIQKGRSDYKGTDIMLRALEQLKQNYSDRVEIVKVESVPFAEYVKLMNGSHVLLDQLYSYTPAMNALAAMAKGLIVVGGGEPENYDILGETELRPIINVLPDEADVYHKLEQLVLHPEQLPELSRQSIEYIRRHHDHIKVAQQYVQHYLHSC